MNNARIEMWAMLAFKEQLANGIGFLRELGAWTPFFRAPSVSASKKRNITREKRNNTRVVCN